jgi:predicted nucleic acid-binding protein
MGTQKVVIDTNVFLAVQNKEVGRYDASKALLDAVDSGEFEGLVSAISLAELCSGYYAAGDQRGREELLAHLSGRGHFKAVPLDSKLADISGSVRAQTGLKLPDAIIIATGVALAASVITYDEELSRAKKILSTSTPAEFLRRTSRAAHQ